MCLISKAGVLICFLSHLSLHKRPSLFAAYTLRIVLIEYVSHH